MRSKRSKKTSNEAAQRRVDVAIDLPVALMDRLSEFAEATGLDQDAIISAAVHKYLAPVEAKAVETQWRKRRGRSRRATGLIEERPS